MYSLTLIPPVSPISRPDLLRQLHVGTDADCDDRQFAGKFRPVLELDPRQFPIFAEKRGDAVIGDDVCSFAPHMVFHQLGEFPVEKSQQLRKSSITVISMPAS